MGVGRVKKHHPRVVACGAVDELSAVWGVAKTFTEHEDIREVLAKVQEHLFVIGAGLSSPKPLGSARQIGVEHVVYLDSHVEKYEAELPPLHHFILAGGTRSASLLHLARAVARRAEREVVALSVVEEVNRQTLAYLNRLSTLLFALARVTNLRAGVSEVEWRGH